MVFYDSPEGSRYITYYIINLVIQYVLLKIYIGQGYQIVKYEKNMETVANAMNDYCRNEFC